MREIYLPPHLKNHLNQGHPWVYRNHVPDAPSMPSGTWVRVKCGGFSAYGLWDATSPIAVRLFARDRVPDAAWVAGRVRDAWERRAALRTGDTTAYRWLFGEGDGLPGITVDLYGEFAVVATYAASVETLVPWVADALRTTASLKGILHRPARSKPGEPEATMDDRRTTKEDPSIVHRPSSIVRLWGQPPPRDLTIRE